MQQLLIPFVVSVHLLLEFTFLGMQLLLVQLSQSLSFCGALVLDINHFIINFFVSFIVIPFLVFDLPLQLLDSVFVLF